MRGKPETGNDLQPMRQCTSEEKGLGTLPGQRRDGHENLKGGMMKSVMLNKSGIFGRSLFYLFLFTKTPFN